MSLRSLAPALCLVLSLASCSARLSVKLQGETGASVDLDAGLGPRTTALIANLAGFSGPSTGPVLDAASLSASLRSVPGISSASLRNPDQRSVSGTVAVSQLDKFLSPRFIRLERSAAGGKISFYLDKSSAPEVFASISPELMDYLTALMAPSATGDSLGAEDYLSTVSSVYGAGVAEEIRTGKLRATVELPGPARSSKGGVVSGRRVDFTVPVVDLLVLEKPIDFDAVW